MSDRNAPCPCGSGKKYKKCCGEKAQSASPRRLMILGAGVAVIVAIGFGSAFFKRDDAPKSSPVAVEQSATQAVTPAAAPPTSAQPQSQFQSQPGVAPPGKVWSKEHGHWHEASAAPKSNPVQIDMSNVPNPNATAGPGMVWSEEHKHWHRSKAAPAAAAALPSGAPPAAPLGGASAPTAPGTLRVLGHEIDTNDPAAVAAAQQGRIWSAQHGHWHTVGPNPHAQAPAPAGVTPTPRANAAPPSPPKQ